MSTRRKSTEEDDYEEEEILVYADFDTVVDNGIIQKDSKFKLIGLDTDEPFLKIGTQMYSGKWLDSVGTMLFFEPEPAPPLSDPVFSNTPKTLMNYKYKTRKCLELSRVFINVKGEPKPTFDSWEKDGTQELSLETKAEEVLVNEPAEQHITNELPK